MLDQLNQSNLILHLLEAVYVVPGVDDLGDLLLGVGRVKEHLEPIHLLDPHHLKQVNIIIFKLITFKFNFLYIVVLNLFKISFEN